MFKITTSTSQQDIVDYADTELGAKLNIEDTKAKLTEQVRELEKAAGITVDEAADKPEVKDVSKSKKKPTKAVIRIHQPPSRDDEKEPDTHWQGVLNGVNYQVAYDEEVEVPYGIYGILKNAVETKFHTKKNPKTGQNETISSRVQRFPFSLIRTID